VLRLLNPQSKICKKYIKFETAAIALLEIDRGLVLSIKCEGALHPAFITLVSWIIALILYLLRITWPQQARSLEN
tara:strand:+ start:67 stop:291 length:225 start_codon:yes stop_codon:yes gene_type:complete